MRYILISLALFLSALPIGAETLPELKTRIKAANPKIFAVGEDSHGTFMPGVFGKAGEDLEGKDIYFVKLVWLIVENGSVKKDSGDVLVENLSGQNELVIGWLGDVPASTKPPAADAYITGRTSEAANQPKRPFTKAEVETFCNTQWKATSGNAAARDVIEFSVENVTPNSVKVRGLFHVVATNNRLRLTYLISLVDANGATTGSNVKFEKVIE